MKQNTSPVSQALRDAGFVPLPRLWVKPKDMPKIHKIAFTYEEEINEIRASKRDEMLQWEIEQRKAGKLPPIQPEREAAWVEHEKLRSQG
jgi:hypothetical protein